MVLLARARHDFRRARDWHQKFTGPQTGISQCLEGFSMEEPSRRWFGRESVTHLSAIAAEIWQLDQSGWFGFNSIPITLGSGATSNSFHVSVEPVARERIGYY